MVAFFCISTNGPYKTIIADRTTIKIYRLYNFYIGAKYNIVFNATIEIMGWFIVYFLPQRRRYAEVPAMSFLLPF
jgi:hypothetical protein